MRKLVNGAAVIALALSANVSAAKAQGVELSLGGGISNPLGRLNDATKLGWNGLAALSVEPAGSPVGIQLDGEYQQFPFDGFSGHERFLIGTGDLVYKFKIAENSAVRPYLIGGGGVYNFKGTGSSTLAGNFSTSGSTTKFGINGGAGFDFKAGGAGLFIEGRFHDVFTSGKDETFVPITVGLRFGGH
jgi:opacity protein-like surface antigen